MTNTLVNHMHVINKYDLLYVIRCMIDIYFFSLSNYELDGLVVIHFFLSR